LEPSAATPKTIPQPTPPATQPTANPGPAVRNPVPNPVPNPGVRTPPVKTSKPDPKFTPTEL
jgi:hypothetical protein